MPRPSATLEPGETPPTPTETLIPSDTPEPSETNPKSCQLIGGRTGWVNSVAFSPDGSLLASGSWDETIRLWDVATIQPLGEPLNGHRFYVNSVAFSPDGSLLASGGDDGTIRLWELDIAVWKIKVCQRINRNLTWQEWQTYFPVEDYHITCPDNYIPDDVPLEYRD